MNPTYFFVFSIGPVQSFIAQARKAQDLFTGCRMVSDYCRYAALIFVQQGGAIIFPKIESHSITNRFVGVIAVESETTAREIGEAIERAVKNRFVEEGMAAIGACLNGFSPAHVKGMKEQLETHLETYWVFSPYDEADYLASFRRAEQVFGMSKYMRTPVQMTYQSALPEYDVFGPDLLGETGRKCAVDGERNVKIYRKSLSEKSNFLRHKLFLTEPEVHIIEANAHTSPRIIQAGEGLSAVSFFKRCYIPDDIDKIRENPDAWKHKYTNNEKGDVFPSTARMAVNDVIARLKDDPAWQNLERLLEEYDDEFVFAENCTASMFQKYSILDIKGVTEAQKAFEQAAKKSGASLHPYYALVALDVDSLGKHMAEQKSSNDHENIAQKLHQFAQKVDTITQTHSGRTLHAGGDDFLLMLNLKYLFPILKEIEETWRSCGLPLSYSTAIVVSHYKAPLTRAVRTVKAELKAAKERFKDEDKNAAACCFMTKSGAATTTYFKQDKLVLLQKLFNALREKKYSPRFIFQFAQNMADMSFHGDTTYEEQERTRQFALWELQRLIVRARDDQRVKKEDAVAFAQNFEALLQEQLREGNTYLDLDNFTRLLKMSELIAKHTNTWPKEDTSA